MLCCTVLYCTVLYCTVLYCTLYCTVLYCTVLYYTPNPFSAIMVLCKIGHFKLVSKIFRNLFELGPRYFVCLFGMISKIPD